MKYLKCLFDEYEVKEGYSSIEYAKRFTFRFDFS